MMFNFRFCSESNEAYLKETFEAVLKKLNLKYEVEWVLSGLPYLTEKKYFIEQIVDSVKSSQAMNQSSIMEVVLLMDVSCRLWDQKLLNSVP